MWIIKHRPLVEYAGRHPEAAASLDRWYALAQRATWKNLAETRRDLPHADQVMVSSGRPVVVFNIAGNHHRLVAAIHFNRQRIFILRVMTHAEYNKNKWKDIL